MKTSQIPVTIVDFPAIRIAVLAHKGDPALLDESVNAFIQWRKSIPYGFLSTDIYNLIYNDPETTKPEDYRLDIGIAVDQDVMANPYGVTTRMIAAGRCALIRHIGSDVYLKNTLDDLYNKWLPESGEILREARPQSGYYVRAKLAEVQKSQMVKSTVVASPKSEVLDLLDIAFEAQQNPAYTNISLACPKGVIFIPPKNWHVF